MIQRGTAEFAYIGLTDWASLLIFTGFCLNAAVFPLHCWLPDAYPRATASGGRKDVENTGGYHKGMAVFIIATGGLMLEASISGQKFSYKPIEQSVSGA